MAEHLEYISLAEGMRKKGWLSAHVLYLRGEPIGIQMDIPAIGSVTIEDDPCGCWDMLIFDGEDTEDAMFTGFEPLEIGVGATLIDVANAKLNDLMVEVTKTPQFTGETA